MRLVSAERYLAMMPGFAREAGLVSGRGGRAGAVQVMPMH